ncbi:TonB-dependent receptor [Porphyromonas cangingivalis]|uniref:Iron complex outermembrane recepter protein n=2 Tax=Porphyromonas cangingivalis TaxID=36874 RepID=A0A1T4KX61_PORCN|nr:TonB-dependent receptor [Porphyromonas cangingivalis]SJZ47006.1 iron complex outermembrane recepter protein [Porphyromonas cangingivalis]VEJ04070.1 Probable TonB-dependent receptor NMB0964 precursor [Porphyromonas cangingivalis]
MNRQGFISQALLTLFVLLLMIPKAAYASSDTPLKVHVLSTQSKETIPGALVKMGRLTFVADADGVATLHNVSGSQVTLSVKALGYKEIKSAIYNIPKGKRELIVRMTPMIHELSGVTVKGQYNNHTNKLQQTAQIDAKLLERSSSVSLAQLLENLPGVSMISTGSTIAKPVIQGMHSSRILLINNGVRLESQTWGDDHAPEIDHTGSNVIEVIKGAESIRYGYGAVGGVVLFNQTPLPYGHDKLFVSGKANLSYGTNARSGYGSMTADFGYKNLGLRIHGLVQKAGDYRSADYRLNNTGYTTISHSALMGYKSRNITATVYTSLFYQRTGLYYNSKISDVNQLLSRFEAGRPDESSIHPFSYKVEPPLQQTQHFTLKGDLKWYINRDHDVLFKVTYQDNIRQEYENRKDPRLSWIPVQDLQLTSYSADALWNGKWSKWNMSTQAGATVSYQYNYNVPGTKQPAFIPNYAAGTVGYFALHKATFGPLELSAGMRYDIRAMSVDGYAGLSSFKYYKDFKMFYNFTSSIAGHYQVSDNMELRANIGWAWRPPDVNELYASGLNHGIYWVVGNKDLTAERGYKAILGGKYSGSWWSIEPGVFYQRVNNYIYDDIGQGKDRFHNHPSGKYPKFVYGQDDARLMGGDLTLTVSPIKGLSVSSKGEWIYARNLTQDAWLPFMPSDRYGLEVAHGVDLGAKKAWHLSYSLEGQFVTKQKRFDPEKDLVGDTPPAYTLLHGSMELQYDFSKDKNIKFVLLGKNMLNALYKEYTDRFRYYAHARGSEFTLSTIITF